MPDLDPQPGTQWLGEWELKDVWSYTTGGKERRHKAWIRHYLELDGHEECCHHTWPVFIDAEDDE